MFRLPEIRRLFRLPFRRDAIPADVDAEFEFHLEMRRRELAALGLPESEAKAEARRRFGDVGAARAELIAAGRAAGRASARITWLADLGRDLRFAGRELRRHRSFTAVAVAVLGLGIGLTTAMASLFDRMALHPLPYPNADRLTVAWLVTGDVDRGIRLNPNRAQRELIAGVPGVTQVDAHLSAQTTVEIDGTPVPMATRIVSIGLIDRLGARIALGRSFRADDGDAASPPAAILSAETWRRRFGSRADILGRAVRVDGRMATIVGVLRPGFDLTSLDGDARAEFWLPLRPDLVDRADDRATPLLTLAPGARPDAVAAGIRARLEAAAGADTQFYRSFRPVLFGAERLVDQSLRRALALLLAAVGLVLLVACGNVAALLLGRAAGRTQEFGVRSALGAGRGRVIRQLVAESVLLGSLGGAAGVAVTAAVLAIARRFRPDTLLSIDDVRLGAPALAVTGLVALVASVVFGLAPVWAVSRTDAAGALVGRSRRPDARGAGRLRSALVIGQIAASLILLVGAGLLVKSFVRLRARPLGFESAGLGQIKISLPERDLPGAARRARLLGDIADRVRRLPGVRAATLSGNGPLDFGAAQGEFLPVGKPWPPSAAKIFLPTRAVSPDFFAVAGVRLVAGVTFGPDSSAAEMIIDEAAARRYWGSPAAAVGQRVRLARESNLPGSVIIGVATDVRGTGDPFGGAPLLYYRQKAGEERATLLVRFVGPPPFPAASRAILATDPGIRIRSAATIDETLADARAGDRFTMVIVAFFSALSLGLAMVGLYGVIAFAVRQRQFEFGVRLALGAVPDRIHRLVLRDGAVPIGLGVVLGLVGSAGLARLIAGLLSGMTPWDPGVFLGAAAVLAGVAVTAIWLPARQAARIDPLEAIRAE